MPPSLVHLENATLNYNMAPSLSQETNLQINGILQIIEQLFYTRENGI
jgi:hypothetical protein